MFTVVVTEKGGAQRRMEFDRAEVTIGRVQGNDIILAKGNVSKRHSRIVLKDQRFIVVDLKSTNGTYVNGRKITSPLVVKPGDKIYIGDFILTLEEGVAEAVDGAVPTNPLPPTSGQPAYANVSTGSVSVAQPQPQSAAGPALRSPVPPPLNPPPAAYAPPVVAPPPLAPPPSVAPPPLPAQTAPIPPPMPSFAPPAPPASAPQTAPIAPGPTARVSSDAQVGLSTMGLGHGSSSFHDAPFDDPRGLEGGVNSPPSREMFTRDLPADSADQISPEDIASIDGSPSGSDAVGQLANLAPTPSVLGRPRALGESTSRLDQRSQSSERVGLSRSAVAVSAPRPASTASQSVSRQPPSALGLSGYETAVHQVLGRVFERISKERIFVAAPSAELESEVRLAIDATIAELTSQGTLDGKLDPARLSKLAQADALGLGTLETLLGTAGVREIVVDSPRRVLVEAGRGLEASSAVFSSVEGLFAVAHRLVHRMGQIFDPSVASYQGMLADGTRAFVDFPPRAARFPLIELRRAGETISPDDLVERGLANAELVQWLRVAIQRRLGILVTGASQRAVSMVLSGLASLCEVNERIVTIEYAPNLSIDHENVASLLASDDGLAPLLRRARVFRANRLVVDSPTELDVGASLSAMASSEGMLLGFQSADPDAALRRLEVLAERAGYPVGSSKRLIAEVANIHLHVGVADDGVYRITALREIFGPSEQGYSGQELYVWRGQFMSTGQPSHFLG